MINKRFKKKYNKLVENRPKLKNKVDNCIFDFSKHIRQSKYYRKPLKGNFLGYEELQVGGDIRIIVKINKERTIAVLEDIGTHSQLDL